MSNGDVCCILGICCPPIQRREKLADYLVKQEVCPREYADAVAEWMVERFDFAPKGSVQPLVDAVSEMARANKKP